MSIDIELVRETLDLLKELLFFRKTLKHPRNKIFEEVVSPLYLGIRPISKNYLDLFRDLRDRFQQASSASEVRDAIFRFKRDREEIVFVRSQFLFGQMKQNIELRISRLDVPL